MIKFCQIVQIFLAFIFIILTIGLISIYMEWNDGTYFKYKSWLS